MYRQTLFSHPINERDTSRAISREDKVNTEPSKLDIELQGETPQHLSYNALTGMPARRSIRFSGMVHGRQLRILMDGGSSNNFIHPSLINRLNISIYPTPLFKVQVGNGQLLQCEGVVRDVPVKIQDKLLFITAFVLPIATEELVLGDIWLETLDTHLVNYKEKFITFFDNG